MNSEQQTNIKSAVELFKLLAVEPRLKIIVLLSQVERMCVGALARNLGITQAAVSQHLRLLKHGRLVNDSRCGYYIHYSLNKAAVRDVQPIIDGFCDPGFTPKKCHKKNCPKAAECEKIGRANNKTKRKVPTNEKE